MSLTCETTGSCWTRSKKADRRSTASAATLKRSQRPGKPERGKPERQARENSRLFPAMWALPELIEAAVRTGHTQAAADALERLAARTRAGGTDFGLGLEARCRALLSEGAAAEACYREAIRPA